MVLLVLFVFYLVPLVRDIWKTFLLLTHEHFFTLCSLCMLQRALLPELFLLPQRIDIYCILHAPAVTSKLTTSFFSFFFIPTWGLFNFLSLFYTVSHYLGFLTSHYLCFSAFCTQLFEFCFITTALVSDTEHEMSQTDSAVSI